MQAVRIQSERQRKLQQLTFAPSSVLSRDLPRDTCLKHIQCRLSGSVVTDFASGTPVADQLGAFDNLVPNISVRVNGGRLIKSVRPYLMKQQQLLTTGNIGESAASAGASASVYPTADVTAFPYGTDDQYTSLRESILISFENPYVDIGRESTWLNLKGTASAEIVFTTAAYSSLLGFANTAPVIYSSSTFVIDMVTTEQLDVPAEFLFSDFRQTTKEVTFSAETTEFAIPVNRGNYLQGIFFLTRDGAAGSTTTASGKLRKSLVVTDLKLRVNGSIDVKATTFQQLQAEMRNRWGLNVPMGSNISLLDGVAYLDLLSNDGRGDLKTALPLLPPAVDSCDLIVTTNNSTNVSYTNPVSVVLMTNEIVRPVGA